MSFHFDHFNINVTDLDRSIKFYQEALGLKKGNEINHPEGIFKIVYLSREDENFRLELTWLRDKEGTYELGDNESHLALRVDNFEEAHTLHSEMGCVCYENPDMGIYFIHDPDDYWIEIIPTR